MPCPNRENKMNAAQILLTVADVTGTPVIQITGGGRSRSAMDARLLSYKTIREFTNMSFSEIGKAVGGREHASVMSGVKTADSLIETDMTFLSFYDKIKEIIMESQPEVGSPLHSQPEVGNENNNYCGA
jgi:chromosomal replication initiation ATPase DnaA